MSSYDDDDLEDDIDDLGDDPAPPIRVEDVLASLEARREGARAAPPATPLFGTESEVVDAIVELDALADAELSSSDPAAWIRGEETKRLLAPLRIGKRQEGRVA